MKIQKCINVIRLLYFLCAYKLLTTKQSGKYGILFFLLCEYSSEDENSQILEGNIFMQLVISKDSSCEYLSIHM